jgi:hypothetical protein
MKSLGLAVLVWAGMFAVIWLAGPRESKGPYTATTCVELANRLFDLRKYHSPTGAENRDMDLCRGQ